MNIMAKICTSICFSGLLIGNALAGTAPFYVPNSYVVQCNGTNSNQIDLVNDTKDSYIINSDTNLQHIQYNNYNLEPTGSSTSNLVYTLTYPDSYIYYQITRISDGKIVNTSASYCGYVFMSQQNF